MKCGEILASEMSNDGLLPVEARLLDIASRRDRVFCCRVRLYLIKEVFSALIKRTPTNSHAARLGGKSRLNLQRIHELQEEERLEGEQPLQEGQNSGDRRG